MNVTVSSGLDVKAKLKAQFPGNSLWGITQNMYLPNRFYLTFRLDNS